MRVQISGFRLATRVVGFRFSVLGIPVVGLTPNPDPRNPLPNTENRKPRTLLALVALMGCLLAGCGQRDEVRQARAELDELRERVRKLEQAAADREKRLQDGLKRVREADRLATEAKGLAGLAALAGPAEPAASPATGDATQETLKKLTQVQEELANAVLELSSAHQHFIEVSSEQWLDIMDALAALAPTEGRDDLTQLTTTSEARVRDLMTTEQWQRFQSSRRRGGKGAQ